MPPNALRIAFFGTDEFSVHSLKLLYAHRSTLNLSSLDLITRSPKRHGRGLKQISEAATAEFAFQAGINVKRADSPEEIESLGYDCKYNMAVAVSYGQLIPSTFIDSLKYGGLNVHPSLLPALRGASPLQYALLKKLEYTGVSVQTLHRTKFDHGDVLYQSDPVKISDNDTVATLRDRLAPLGAQGLVTVLEQKRYMDIDKYKVVNTSVQPSYAPRIPKTSKKIDFWTMDSSDIELRHRVFGSLYAFQDCLPKKQKTPRRKRLILFDIRALDSENIKPEYEDLNIGEYLLTDDKCIVKATDGFIESSSIQLEGEKREHPAKFLTSMSARGIKKPLLV